MSESSPAVLLVGNFLSSTRRYRLACEELAVRLQRAGWIILTTSEQPHRLKRLVDMARSAWRWRRNYVIANVDVFSGSAFLWAEVACWTLRRAKRPYVLTLRGGELPRFAERWPRRVRRLLQSSALSVAPSRYLLEQMAPYANDLLLVPNAIELGAYTFRARHAAQPNLFWLRAFHEIYNAPLAPEVLARLVPDFADVRLVMVGPDRDGSLSQTRDRAEHLHVLDRIQFPGGVSKSDVPRWMNAGDVFLNTTNADNTPVSVLEAMACGLCVVSTSVGGIPYLLEDGKDALLVPPNDADAMARAVRRILSEPGLAERLSTNGRAKALRHDWSVVLPQWEALFRRVAALTSGDASATGALGPA